MSYEPINNIEFQGGINTAEPLLSPASQNTLDEGTWNSIVNGDGYVKPFSGVTSQGDGSGGRKMLPFGNTWGVIKDIAYEDHTFAPADVNTGTDIITIADHGYQTGTAGTFTTSGTLPAPLALVTTYYLIRISSSTFKVATSLINALAGTAINLTTQGTGTHTVDVSNTAITASGSFFQDIGRSRWGIGSGQPAIEGVNVDGFTLSTNLQLQIASSGVYAAPVQAGLSQPSAPEIGILDLVGDITNSMSAKLARSRPSTGAVSLASPVSAVILPQANRIYLVFPAASTSQTHWRVYFPFQGFGGIGVHYLGSYGGETDIAESVVAAGTVTVGGATVARALEFNFKDGDLLPIEASFDNYPPPAATHAIRLETVMCLAGCYSDSVSDPTSTSTGTAIAVSKENDYESYVPTSLLFLAEPVVDVLARPIDDYGYVACGNSIQALQYVGNRGDELPSCTLTTILPDIGIEYPHNWSHFRGRLVIYTTQGNLIMMDESGNFDTEFAGAVSKILRTFSTADTQVAQDPKNDSIIVMNGKRMLVYSIQRRQWRQIWLRDFGVTYNTLSAVTAKRTLYFSVAKGSSADAYSYDTGSDVAPLSFVCNYQSGGGSLVQDINELAVAVQTTETTIVAICINRNLEKTAFRNITVTNADENLINTDSDFIASVEGQRYVLFGPGVGGLTDYLTGTITNFLATNTIEIDQFPQADVAQALLFIGDWVEIIDVTTTRHLRNRFPYLVELRSYQMAVWFQASNDVGNLLGIDVLGTSYPSSRAL